MRKASSFAVLLSAVVLAACPDSEQRPAPPETPAPGAPTPAPVDPGVAAQLPPGVTVAMVSEGQQLYATVCVACHGVAGAGTQLGPALNDQNWIHITGEYQEIVNISATGVPQPREYPAPMPPMGGGNFTEEQLRAISAYVYTLSHGG